MSVIKNILANEKVKKGINVVKYVTKKGFETAIPILEVVIVKTLLSDNKTTVVRYYGEVKYDDAIKAIMESGMFSSDKTKAIETLKMDGTSELYSGVINIVNSNMFSSDKLKSIKHMNETN